MRDKIFEGEMTALEMKKFYAEKRKLKKRKKHPKKTPHLLNGKL